jgi:intracellular sulfur oxidation DsrE/DsrF family protein
MRTSQLILPACFLFLSSLLFAQDYGPVIQDFGPTWEVDNPDYPTSSDLPYRVVFDVAKGPESPADQNPSLITLARFLNMHAKAGVPVEELKVIAVLHGGAAKHALDDQAYQERYGVVNPHTDLFRQLKEAGVKVYLCGQSMHARKLPQDSINPNIGLALSAMTVLIKAQAEGYSVISM